MQAFRALTLLMLAMVVLHTTADADEGVEEEEDDEPFQMEGEERCAVCFAVGEYIGRKLFSVCAISRSTAHRSWTTRPCSLLCSG